ncbi:BlaI/MecI/CopY family transcriptional regulator [Hydrotalea sp.]|uniref:BlaI/MecI/CopY family transcriptional regulator n=1 Tax=Hydrotalea sp. TaxID=2881279 RepID=UPI0026169356|nr:BlaI/MecI/CopY family transcriptional regulator [Hydrotalea sp.]
MKSLTKAEEQIMLTLWKLGLGYLKDIIEAQPEPKPHNNTIATIIKILVEKGFIGIRTHGRVNEYYPLISKEAYTAASLKNMVEGYFSGSFADVVSFMLEQKKLKTEDLELLLEHIKNKK